MARRRRKKWDRRRLLQLYADSADSAAAKAAMEKLIFGEPELISSLRWIWEAFWILNSSRSGGGFGPSALSLSEIYAYCKLYEIRTFSERNMLVRCIQAMDSEYMRFNRGSQS